jgi:hypothetical protein
MTTTWSFELDELDGVESGSIRVIVPDDPERMVDLRWTNPDSCGTEMVLTRAELKRICKGILEHMEREGL